MKSQELEMKTGNWWKDLRKRLRKEEKEKTRIPFDSMSLPKVFMLIYYTLVMVGMYKIAYGVVMNSVYATRLDTADWIALNIGLTGFITFFIIDMFIRTNKHARIAYKRFVWIRRMKHKKKMKMDVTPYDRFDSVPVGQGRKK